MRGSAILLVVIAAVVAGGNIARAQSPSSGRVGWIIDGDTFGLVTGERIRIAGIDAAETRPDQAKCRAELALGRDAKARATALLKGRSVSLRRVGRSYNRTVATA